MKNDDAIVAEIRADLEAALRKNPDGRGGSIDSLQNAELLAATHGRDDLEHIRDLIRREGNALGFIVS